MPTRPRPHVPLPHDAAPPSADPTNQGPSASAIAAAHGPASALPPVPAAGSLPRGGTPGAAPTGAPLAPAASTAPPAGAAPATPAVTVFDMPLDQLQSHVAQALVHLVAVQTLLPGLLVLAPGERRRAARFRTGEAVALESVLDAVEVDGTIRFRWPAGSAPTSVPTVALRDGLERRNLLAQIQDAVSPFEGNLSDTVFVQTTRVRPPILVAYRAVKPHADASDGVASALGPALSFYGTIGRRSAVTRKKSAAAAAAPAPAPAHLPQPTPGAPPRPGG